MQADSPERGLVLRGTPGAWPASQGLQGRSHWSTHTSWSYSPPAQGPTGPMPSWHQLEILRHSLGRNKVCGLPADFSRPRPPREKQNLPDPGPHTMPPSAPAQEPRAALSRAQGVRGSGASHGSAFPASNSSGRRWPSCLVSPTPQWGRKQPPRMTGP